MSYAAESPEGTLLCPSALLHLGSRAAVDQALSRLARKGRTHAGLPRRVYVWPVQTRFGPRPHLRSRKVLAYLCPRFGVRRLYLAVGPQRMPLDSLPRCRYGPSTLPPALTVKLKLGGLAMELRHAPRWQLGGTVPARR